MVKSTDTTMTNDNSKVTKDNKNPNSVTILIIEKNSTMKNLTIKNYDEEELYKKCGFKKKEGFEKKTTWNLKIDGKKYYVHLFAKEDGKSNFENKYDFPPPVDKKLFFGSCAVMTQISNEIGGLQYIPLTIPLWEKMYEKLFGGFEDLTKVTEEDDDEDDELENIPLTKKTKVGGYLKDGFVVDDDDAGDEEDGTSVISYEETEDDLEKSQDKEEELILEDIGSELSEEEYLSSDDEE